MISMKQPTVKPDLGACAKLDQWLPIWSPFTQRSLIVRSILVTCDRELRRLLMCYGERDQYKRGLEVSGPQIVVWIGPRPNVV